MRQDWELVYRDSQNSPVFNPNPEELNQVLQKAKKRHIKEREEIHAVSRDLAMFIRNGSHIQAAYILHETIWELYYTASWFLTGTSISHKSITKQQAHIIDYSHSIGTLFEIYDNEDAVLLQELGLACDAVCQNFSIAISKKTIPLAVAKAEYLQHEIKHLYEENIQICKDKFSQSVIDIERAGEEIQESVSTDELKMKILLSIRDM